MTPFKKLEYLYIGTADFDRDVAYYRDVLGAELVWAFANFGARVAGFRVCAEGPLHLLADHKSAPSCEPIYSVEDLNEAFLELENRGWTKQEGPLGTPNGHCYTYTDPSGNHFAFLQNDRPDAMESHYADPNATTAIRFDAK